MLGFNLLNPKSFQNKVLKMKGITPIITVILLLLIAVVMVGFAFGFFSNIFTTTSTETTSALNTTVSIYGKQVRIDSIDSQATRFVTLRAVGSRAINSGDIVLYVAGNPVNILGSCPGGTINPGGTNTCILAVGQCPPGSTLRAVAPGNENTAVCP